MTKFEFETLTIEEVEIIETITGKSIDKIADEGALKGKLLKAVVYVLGRRENPKFSMDDAGKVSFKEAMEMFAVDVDDPKDE